LHPDQRFSGLSESYSRFRPDYPASALDWIIAYARLTPGSLMIDLGAGTGIASRAFAARGLRVIGIEPNEEMRSGALRQPGRDALEYRSGSAEATGLPSQIAHLVLAAQAFHWFKPDQALDEAYRILKDQGCIALMWNERDEKDPFTALYGGLIRSFPEAKEVESFRHEAGNHLLQSTRFREARRDEFEHLQTAGLEELLGRTFSASYAPRDPVLAKRAKGDLRQLFRTHEQDGHVVIRYRTSVYIARR
jgi:ubiquinone/menaquinone biosynthesis C-methylase UbiE